MSGKLQLKAFLEQGFEFQGKFTFSGIVRLNGVVRGEIFSDDTLIIGETAKVYGNIYVNNVVVAGKVSGDISAKQRLEIKSSAYVKGDVHASRLVIEEGARLLGQMKVETAGTLEQRTPTPVLNINKSMATNHSKTLPLPQKDRA